MSGMISFMERSWYLVLIAVVASYLLGSINTAIIVTKIATKGKEDIRNMGSGNAGFTNVLRSVGKVPAILTIVCDLLKSVIAVLIGGWLFAIAAGNTENLSAVVRIGKYICGFFCILGHSFPIYFRFKGGKGIAVGLGASLGFFWPIGLSALAVFILLVIPTRYISLGSIAAAISMPIFSFVWGVRGPSIIPVVILSIVVVWSHRENIGRLLRGEERKFSVSHKKDGE